ncbi:MAG TPA: LysR family transcriptional regulator [Vitreimonas sp.]|uniref:LysR family transcriptional regulator n=1 Tax=Vitreimonas sp. TaxID=3069702 RepID=UPI002D3008D4|nr:LysR family transcriptional regulator [Vitreimonas sp.]HYD86008.1 LysR family transcriptional regulator [Vitreimonas sp.]
MAIPENKKPIAASQQLDWADLHFFLAVAEERSLNKAAQRLQTTQPTVSKRLAELERRLGATLALRSNSGIELTEEGRFVASQAAAMARSVQHITQEVAMRDREPAGEVSISCPDAMLSYFIAPSVPQLHRVFPSIQLLLRSKQQESEAPADIAIQFHETKRMEDVAIPLGWLHHAAFAAQTYLDLYGGPKDIGEAFQHRMLMHTGYISQPERWRPKQSALQDILDFSVRTDCGTALVALTACGGGVASMPTYVARIEPRLVMLDVGELARIRFWLVFDRERGQLPRVRETIDWLKRVFDPAVNPWFREEFIPPSEFDEAMREAGRKKWR